MTLTRSPSTLLGATPLAVPQVPAHGLVPQNFTKWRKAMTAVAAGTGYAKILLIGDSITAGAMATGANPRGPGGAAWPAQFLKYLNSGGFAPTTFGLTITSVGIPVDTRWGSAGTLPSGWVAASNVGWANVGAYQGAVGATTLPFAPGINCDTFDIYYAQYSGDGTFKVNIDGGADTVVNSAGASSIQKVTLTSAAGSAHVVNFNTVTTNPVVILGVDAYLSTAFSIRVGNAGIQGTTSTQWAGGPAGLNSVALIQAYAPDLTVISLCTNDAAVDSASPSTVAANHHTLVVAARASGDVILTSAIPNGANAGWEALIQSYITTIQEQAFQDGVGYVDFHGRWGSYAISNALGYYSSDHTHPANPGYSDLATAMVLTLMQISGQVGGTFATLDSVSGNIAASAPGDTGLAGSRGFSADSGHRHPRESFAAPTIALGSAAAAGAAGTLIRSDATIAAFDTTLPAASAVADAGAVGTAAFAARRDHKHPREAVSTVAGQQISKRIWRPVTAVTYTTTSSTYASMLRTVADMVTNGTTTITSATAAFVATDVGALITGSADIPAGTTIATYVNATTVTMSAAATGSHTGQTLSINNMCLRTVISATTDIRITLEALMTSGSTAQALFVGVTASNFSSGAIQPCDYMLSDSTYHKLFADIDVVGVTAGTYDWVFQWAVTGGATAHLLAGGSAGTVSTSTVGPAVMRAFYS